MCHEQLPRGIKYLSPIILMTILNIYISKKLRLGVYIKPYLVLVSYCHTVLEYWREHIFFHGEGFPTRHQIIK